LRILVAFDLNSLSSIATAVGVTFAAIQLWMTRQQAVLQFEDSLAVQYRDVVRRLPVEAFLGESLSDERQAAALKDFIHYFDLSNEQAFLRQKKRVRRNTWREWEEGIVQNMKRPAFAQAWTHVSSRAPESFNELRALVGEGRLHG
jgi:hypothetical protein